MVGKIGDTKIDHQKEFPSSELEKTTSSAHGRMWSTLQSTIHEIIERVKNIKMYYLASPEEKQIINESAAALQYVDERLQEVDQAIHLKDTDDPTHIEILKELREGLMEDLQVHAGYKPEVLMKFKMGIVNLESKIKERTASIWEKAMEMNSQVSPEIGDKKLAHDMWDKAIESELSLAHDHDDEKFSSQLQNVYPLVNQAIECIANKKEIKTTNEYLVAMDELAQTKEKVQEYASIFQKSAPEIHEIVQFTMNRLESKIKELEVALCKEMKENFKPDPKTPGDGSCMFWSIQQLHDKQKSQDFYRETAANYIIDHPEEFFLEFSDQMITYLNQKYGDKSTWDTEILKDLDEETRAELYADALVHSKSPVWGGAVETMALSKALGVPILTFTANDDWTTWRLDIAQGQSEFKDKPPILLYYNGHSHYQSLISK